MRGGIPSILAAILTAVVLFTLTGYQITTATAGTRLLGRLGAALVELNLWVPAHQQDLDLLARDRPTEPVAIKDLPITVTVPASQLIDTDPSLLTEALRHAMGKSLYKDGTDALQNGEGGSAHLSIGESVRWTVTLVSSGMHGIWAVALAIAFLLLLASSAAVMTTGRWPLGPIAVGAGVATAIALVFWVLAQVVASSFSSPIDKETALIFRDGAWIGVRDAAAIAVAATVLLFLLSRHFGQERSTSYQTPVHDPDSSPF